MANALQTVFTDIANAIRGKTGKTDAIAPANMASEIESITTGGGNTGGWAALASDGASYMGEEITVPGENSRPITIACTLSDSNKYRITINDVEYETDFSKSVVYEDIYFSLYGTDLTFHGDTVSTTTCTLKLERWDSTISGGGEVSLQDKTITENGTYTADEGYDGLGNVTVNVAASGGIDWSALHMYAGTVNGRNFTVIKEITDTGIWSGAGTNGNMGLHQAYYAGSDDPDQGINVLATLEVLTVGNTYDWMELIGV